MKYYLIGEDKSLKEIGDEVLMTAGGNMTGNIGFDSGVRVSDAIRFIKGDNNGSGIAIGDGGLTLIGSGESVALLAPAEGSAATQEKMVVASDTYIDFYVNCQNGADGAVKVTLNPNGQFTGHQKAITSGTAAPSGGSNGDIYIQY
jgi:hypothetical protein